METLLTTEDVAEWLRLEVVTVRRLITRGELPAYRVGGEYRFKREDLEEYLEGQKVTSSQGSRRQLTKLTDRVQKLLGVSSSGGEFDRFTGRAQGVLALAQKEAVRLHHTYIGTEHLLLGIASEGKGVAAGVLHDLGVEPEALRQAVERNADGPQSCEGAVREIALTARAKESLALAVSEARHLGHSYVGTEHLLLGIVQTGESVGAKVLREFGIEVERTRQRTIQVLEAKAN